MSESKTHGDTIEQARMGVALGKQLSLTEKKGIVNGVVLGDYGDEAARVVVPHDAARSVLWARTQSTTPGLRMPPLARSERDEAFLAVLSTEE